MTIRVGLIGLGRMGTAMAGRLLNADYGVWVHNRSPERADALVRSGAHWADTPRELAENVDFVISTVADDAALNDVAMSDSGVLAASRTDFVYVDMSTVSVSASQHVAHAAAARSITYLRAPVTGSTALAESGSLGILISGEKDSVEDVKPVLAVLGDPVFYLGESEEARVMKLALNMVLASTIVGLTEALVLGESYGLDRKEMLEIFSDSAVGSPLIRYKSATLASSDFSAAFSTTMLMKDLDLATALGRDAGLPTPATGLNRDLMQATAGLGLGEHDFASVVLLYETLSGRRKPQSQA